LDIGLPLGLGIEIGAMYKRVDQQIGQQNFTFIDGDTGAIEGTGTRAAFATAGQSWEVPIAVQYHFRGRRLRPYVEAGFSYNYLSDVLGQEALGELAPPPKNSEGRTGFLLGAGTELKLGVIHATPGLRYTHYSNAQEWLPSANAVDFLLGITFVDRTMHH
jgi:hypothetical protein